MPLDVVRLGDSDLAALSTGDEFKASVLLWCKSWLQVPAASLPDDDRVLAHLTGLGPRWKKVKAMALKGWIKCADGRLYHPVVAEKAREAWKHRLAQRERVAKRWNKANEGEAAPPLDATRSTKRSERMAEARRKGTHTTLEWAAMLDICENKCVKCEADDRLEKDHILPVYAGGSDVIDNLQPLCPRCNCGKGADQSDLRPTNWKARLHATVGNAVGNAVGNERLQGTGTVKGEAQPKPAVSVSTPKPEPCTREELPTVTSAADALNYVCKAADWRAGNDTQRQNGISIINGWLALGCTLDLILSAIAKARKRDPSPTRSLKRFDSTVRGIRRDQLGGELPVTSADAQALANGVACRLSVANR